MKKKYIRRIIILTVIVSLGIIYYIGGFFYRDHCNNRQVILVRDGIEETNFGLCKLADYIYPHEESKQWKPIIYLYPEHDEIINVKLGYPKSITTSYPKYNNGWNVKASPNGDLVDLKTNKKLYSLYYENIANYNFQVKEDGFVIKGKDASNFLEEKLPLLGLNEKETEEFIIYWLPKLEENEYNYIRFATLEEQNKSMPLIISKKPDTLIRVMMTYKKINKPIKIKEQKIKTPNRIGFTVVEWGGTEIK